MPAICKQTSGFGNEKAVMSFEFNDAQHNALDQAARRTEAQRLLPVMRKSLRDHVNHFNDVQLEDNIAAALHRAAAWGEQTRTSATDFVILWLMVGPEFDQQAGIKAFLDRRDSGMDAKISGLMAEFKWQLHVNEGK